MPGKRKVNSKLEPFREDGTEQLLTTNADEHRFDFDLLDATKLVPEELVPVQRVGRLTLTRNPENFFAETEQVAFHPGHLVAGIDFTDDPLLQGRLFSYTDTQLIRLGGPNFHEIPINRPVAPVHNNQRDGLRQTINEKQRLLGEKFFDHFSQATMFWNSQFDPEKEHLDGPLNRSVPADADSRNYQPRGGKPPVAASVALSMANTITDAKTRKVAILAADVVDGKAVDEMRRRGR